jgi:hypothetical protein
MRFLQEKKMFETFQRGPEIITVKLWLYNPGFYVFREFTHFLYGPSQMPITAMSNFTWYYVSANLRFLWICTSLF